MHKCINVLRSSKCSNVSILLFCRTGALTVWATDTFRQYITFKYLKEPSTIQRSPRQSGKYAIFHKVDCIHFTVCVHFWVAAYWHFRKSMLYFQPKDGCAADRSKQRFRLRRNPRLQVVTVSYLLLSSATNCCAIWQTIHCSLFVHFTSPPQTIWMLASCKLHRSCKAGRFGMSIRRSYSGQGLLYGRRRN